MLRLSILCLVAGAAVASAGVNLDVVAQLPYTKNLRLVNQANLRLSENLANSQPLVNTPQFHYLLVLGVVELTGKRIDLSVEQHTPLLLHYIHTLDEDLPGLYRDLPEASRRLAQVAQNVSLYLEPLTDLVKNYCKNLDDKDCDKVVEYQVEDQPNNLALKKAVVVLESAVELSRSYLRLHEDLKNTANSFRSFSYLLQNREKLSSLSLQHANLLFALNTQE